MRNRRVASILALGVASILVLASCGFGVTGTADEVTPISARLRGTARNTVAGYTPFLFEYGPTEAYGSVSGETTYIPTAGGSQEVFQPIGGLTDDTTYHYRLCVYDASRAGTCGADATFTTPAGDYVQGNGVVATIYLDGQPPFQIVVGGSMDASSAPDGSNAAGDGWVRPSTGVPVVSDRGTVTCLKVVGNRAAIGLEIPGQSAAPSHHDVVFIEDNGSTGDRWDASTMSAPFTTCPSPTEANFDGFWFSTGGPAINYGSTLSSGDFVVHDHP